MKLDHVQLENFRQFLGRQDADFSSFDDLNVTVFHGDNGAGKTSLFSAINWCLYGEGAGDIGQLVSKPAIAQASEGETITASVTIWFIHNATRFIAERRTSVIKSGSEVLPAGDSYSLFRVRATGDSEPVPNPIGQMNAILPANVRPYFFFDGEKMDDLTRAENREVQEAIRNVMRLPALERGEKHLSELAAEFRRELKQQGSAELEKLISREEGLREKREKALRNLEENREEVRLVRQQITDLETQLRETGAARDLQAQRDRITRLLGELETQERDQLARIQEFANRSYIKLLPQPAEAALRIIDDKRQRGEIPSGIREQLIQDILDSYVCICGRPFAEHDEAFQGLVALRDRTTSSELEAAVTNLGADLRSLATITGNQLANLERLLGDYSKTKENMKRSYAELDDIRRQLAASGEAEIAGLEKRRSDFQRNLERLIAAQGRLEAEIEQLAGSIEEIIKEKRAAEAKERRLALLTKKEEIAQKAADAVTRIKNEFFEQTRKEIEAATKDVFGKLAWKQEHFHDIQLDQDFRLEVIDRWGMPTRKELSAGERQILSLAFITAMSRVAGEAAPLVMDTPFGRLSGNHLSAVAENLPNLTAQLVLFVTDREWDEASKTNLEPRAGAQYELRFDRSTGCTEIVEVAFL